MTWAITLGSLCALLAFGMLLLRWRRIVLARRLYFIRRFSLPGSVLDKLVARHPHLRSRDVGLAVEGLRRFFQVHLLSGRKFVAMPSRVVDDLWHEFILHTRDYRAFCAQAFGGFLHHAPASSDTASQLKHEKAMSRCWLHACQQENIDPVRPKRLPLLFAIDQRVKLRCGFRYSMDKLTLRQKVPDMPDMTTHFSLHHHLSSIADSYRRTGGEGGESASEAGGGDAGGCGGGCGGGGGGGD